MNSLLTSFRKRLALVMIFFSLAPIVLFGVYAYDDLSDQRRNAYEQGFYYAFSNDMEKLSLWLEGKKLNMLSDGKLHFLSDQAGADQGVRDGRSYVIIREGDPGYGALEAELKATGTENMITKFVNFNANVKVADERTLLQLYVKDQDLKSGVNYFVREEIHLKELVRAVEFALKDQFASYSIFIGDRILYTQNKMDQLDPYSAYYNRSAFTTVTTGDSQYMGIYAGNDAMGIHVAAFRDYSYALKQIRQYQSDFFLKVFTVGLIGAILSLMLARRINYPIQKLKVAVEDILSGNIESRIQVDHRDEFGQIYESFNRLAEIETANYRKMVETGGFIGDKNRQLIELNRELETSYQHLREAMTLIDLSSNKQEALINNIGELIWTMDPDGTVTFVNHAVVERLGYLAEEFVGRPITAYIDELESGDSVGGLLEKLPYADLQEIGAYFAKKDSDERIFMHVNTKRIYEEMNLKSIQGFARAISDDWVIHHMTLRRNKEMEITGQISWVLANNILLDELVGEIVKKIEQLLHPDLCLIGLMEEGEAVISRIGGSFCNHTGKIKLSMGSDAFVAKLVKEQMIRSGQLEDCFLLGNPSAYGAIQDYVVLPLKFDQNIIGFFSIASAKRLSDGDLKVLQIIANQSAIAIDKAQLYKTLKEEYLNTIRVLATAVEAKDAYTEGHSFRVSKMAKLIAQRLSHSDVFVEEIEISGILHDIGKIGIFDQILTKKGRLSPVEYDEIMRHPEIGYKIIHPIQLSQPIIDGILLHHKRYDLKGYPEHIVVDTLPLSAGIIGVADAIDAITSNRSYSAAKGLEHAMAEVEKHTGSQFHPEAASAVLSLYRESPELLEQIIREERQS